jgi:hypothetical protein
MPRKRRSKQQMSHPHLDRIVNLGDLPVELAEQVWELVQDHCPKAVDPSSLGAIGGIKNLPEDLIKQIEWVITNDKAASYNQLADYINQRLQALGMEKRIPASTIALYGRNLLEEQQALRDAQQLSMAIAQAVPEDDGTLASATLMVAKSNLFQIAKNFNPEDVQIRSVSDFSKFARAMLDVMRATNDHSSNMSEIRRRIASATDEVVTIARDAGADDRVLAEISSKLLGIPLEVA